MADAGPDQTVVVGDRVDFDASLSSVSGGSIASYNWSFTYNGAETKLSGVRPNFTFQTVGEYSVTLNVTDEVGHSATDQVVIKVTAKDAWTSSLLYSGGAAAVVAALLLIVFFAMRSSRRGTDESESEDASEEEFEET